MFERGPFHRRRVPSTGIALLLSALPAAAIAQSVAEPQAAPGQPGPGQAPDAGSTGAGLQEIVVTARSRKENVERVPDTITAFDSEQIESARIQDVFGFTRLTPGLSIVEASQSPGIQLINIRGIGQQFNSEAPVAVVVDGVQTTSTAAITQKLFDVDQIEVLKGPQGALYGRNAIGGAIIITTPMPTDDFTGWAQVGAGSNGYWDTVFSLSGPIVQDKVLFRLAGSDSSYDGDFRNSTTGLETNRLKDRDLQGRLLIKPVDDVTIDIRSSYSETRNAGYNGVVVPDGGIDDFSLHPESWRAGSGYRRVYEEDLRLSVDTPLGEIASTASYTNTLDESGYDLGELPYPTASVAPQVSRVSAASEDLRITSPSDQPLRYVVGAYYLNSIMDRLVDLDLYPGFFDLLGVPPFLQPPTPFLDQSVNTHSRNNAWSGFAQVNYDLTSQIELTGAFRYDSDDYLQHNNLNGTDQSTVFSKPQPKVSINYRPESDIDLYATAGQGFRSGGFNAPSPVFPAIYSSETSTSYEIGAKTTLLNHRLQLNVAAFHTIYDDEQVTLVDVEHTGAQGIVNIPRSVLNGGEIELQAMLTERLWLSGGGSYVDSDITNFSEAPQYVGNRTPYTPEFTFNVGADYTWPFAENWQATFHVDYAGQAGMYYDYFNSAKQGTYGLTNLRASVDKDNWRLSFFAENLFDVAYYADYTSDITTAPFGLNYAIRGRGQLLGGELRYRF